VTGGLAVYLFITMALNLIMLQEVLEVLYGFEEFLIR